MYAKSSKRVNTIPVLKTVVSKGKKVSGGSFKKGERKTTEGKVPAA